MLTPLDLPDLTAPRQPFQSLNEHTVLTPLDLPDLVAADG